MFEIGSFVHWAGCPHAAFSRGQIVEVKGNLGRLRHFATFHPLEQFEATEPTGKETYQCSLYGLEIPEFHCLIKYDALLAVQQLKPAPFGYR